MMRVTGWALRALALRGRSQWGLLTVVTIMSLFATTLTTGLALTSRATRDFGLARTLQRLGPGDVTVVTTVGLGSGRPLEPALSTVSAALDDGLGVPIASRTEATESEWNYPDAPMPRPSMLYFAHRDDAAAHLTVVSGRIPGPRDRITPGPIPVAVPRSLAQTAKLALGSRLPTTDASTDKRADAVVVGIYEITARQRLDQFWTSDLLDGATRDDAYTAPRSYGMFTRVAYGPVLTPRESFTVAGLQPSRAVLRTVPVVSATTPAALPGLQERVAALSDAVQGAVGRSSVREIRVDTRLTAALDVVHRALVVTTAGLLIGGLLVVVLAVAALLLATRLLAERRSTEQTLMRARGASGAQLAGLAALEAGAIAAAVTVAAPLLARPAYLTLTRGEAFVAAGLHRDPGLPALAWVVAAATAVVLVTVLLTPLLRRSGTFVEQEQAAARQDRRTLLQRSGLDVGLVVLAAVGYWQLLRYASPLTDGERGPSVDPLLVAGPALVLLAGGLLSVRVVPALGGLLERVAGRRRGLVWPLAWWEVGRRARRSARAVLLLALTVASGTFALADLATWGTSQVDQADARVGTDAVVDLSPALRTEPGTQLPRLSEAAAAAGVRLDRTAPALVDEVGLSVVGEDVGAFGRFSALTAGVPVQVLAVDSTRAGAMLRGRVADPRDEAGALARHLSRLTPPRAGGIALPRGTTHVSVDAWLRGENVPGPLSARLHAVVDDAAGVRHRVQLVDDLGDQIGAGGPRQRMTAPLPSGIGTDGKAVLRAFQVTWVHEIDPQPNPTALPMAILSLTHVTGGTAQAPAVLPLTGMAEATLAGGGMSGGSLAKTPVRHPSGGPAEAGLEVSVFLVPDWTRPPSPDNEMTSAVVAWKAGAPVPMVATAGALKDLGVGNGDEVAVLVGRTALPAAVVALAPFVPGTDPYEQAILVDGDALSRRLVEYGDEPRAPNRWWVTLPDGDVPALTTAVERLRGMTTSAATIAREARRAPLAVGQQGARRLVVVAAAVLAGAGFALTTAVAIRLRRIEFAQLLSLGARRRDLDRVVAAEAVLLWAVGTACGLAVGLLLTRTLPSLVAMSAQSGRPLPPVAVHVPWPAVGLLVACVALVLALVVAIVTRSLRGSVLGAVLRLGDER